MNTYPTYQAAKIANPDSEILKARDDWEGCPEYIGKFIANKPNPQGGEPYIGKGCFEVCNPADYYIRTKAVNMNETEIFKAIEATYGYGILMAFADLLERDKDMKTFETEKHNMPEGATHYHNENDDYEFCWFKIVNGEWFAYCPKEAAEGWKKCIDEHERDGFEAIPTETQEEKEALDAIEKTYRYEKVEDTGFFELKDEFQGRMIFFNQSATSTPDYAVAMTIIELSHHYMQKNLYRRIEVTERELFIDHMRGRYPEVCIGVFEYAYEKLKLVNGKG